MKNWIWAVVAAGLGITAGVGTTAFELAVTHEGFLPSDYDTPDAKVKQKKGPRVGEAGKYPKAEVIGGAEYNFGTMERYAVRRHKFEIKNVGKAALTLEPLRTTCKCTLSSISGSEIKPGESGIVTLEWTGRTLGNDPEFYQTAEILTNVPDEDTIRLSVRGYVTESIRALPEELVISRVSSNEGARAEFRLFGFRSKEIKVLSTDFEDSKTAENFALIYEPLPEEEVKQEKGASCGLLARLEVKPGLPLGPIKQTIRIKVDLDKETTLHIPVEGTVVSDIMIASTAQFHSAQSLLTFGSLKRGESAKAVLHMFVRGPHRHETKFTVGAMDPKDYYRVSISPPQDLNQGKTVKYLVTVELPPGQKPMNRMGSQTAKHGRIVLETTHPQTKQVYIYVKFAVE